MSNEDWNESIVNELRRLAGAAMRAERAEHTLQPTALVNEAYMVLQRQNNIDLGERSVFMAAAATTIRRILVDHARRRRAEKRGGPDAKRKQLLVSMMGDNKQDLDVLDLHDAMNALAEQSERAAKVVELRFFGGLTGEEIAEHLDVSLRTVNNDWKFSKAWLYKHLDDGSTDSSEATEH